MMETGAAIGASRLTVGGGDTEDFSVVAEKLAEMAELAQPYRASRSISNSCRSGR